MGRSIYKRQVSCKMLRFVVSILMFKVPIARCGYYEYAVIRDVFEMKVPGLSEDVMAGLEGNSNKMRGVVADTEKSGVMRGEDAEVEGEHSEDSK